MATNVWLVVSVTVLLSSVNCAKGSEEVVIEVAEKSPFTFVMSEPRVASGDVCRVKTPSREESYLLDPLPLGGNQDVRIRFSDQTKMACGVRVASADARLDTGVWRIYITNATGSYGEEFTVRVVVPTRNVIPKMPVSIEKGQDLYLRFEDLTVSKLIECRVNWTNGDVVLRPGSNVDPLVSYWGAGLANDCGVKATRINVSDSGTWTLRAQNTTGQVIEGTFQVTVLSESFPSETEEILIAGDFKTLDVGANNSKYCQAQNPSGQWEELKRSACAIKLGKVTKAHEGKWTARFAVPGQVDELRTTLSVKVKESDVLDASYSPSVKHPGALDLLCRWTTLEYASIQAAYCRFVRPDGVAMSLEDGVGSANYSYYGDGLNFSYSVKDCGVTIHNPEKRDVGTWQCLIGVDLQNIIKGGFIHVPSMFLFNADAKTFSDVQRDIKVTGGETDIVIQDQDPLVLSCQATASLNYCWFGHPNGTTFTAHGTTTTSKSRALKSGYSYTGQGLALGDCTITLKTVSHQDAGKWSCNMGVTGGVDLKVSITVRVAGGNIAAHGPTVDVTSDSAFLRCQSIPSGVALQYCRFVRPDGVGFGFTTNNDVVMRRYRYDGEGLERGVCGLKIDTVGDEDFGHWTCAALHVATNVEGKADIILTDQRELSSGAVAGIVIGSCVAAILLGVPMYYIYRKHRTRS